MHSLKCLLYWGVYFNKKESCSCRRFLSHAVTVCPVSRHHLLGFSEISHEPSSSTSRRTTRSISATSWESCSLRNVLKQKQGQQERRCFSTPDTHRVQHFVKKQWGKPRAITYQGWLTRWDTGSEKKRHRLTQVWKCLDVNAHSHRSSASPPIQRGLFSLESRL